MTAPRLYYIDDIPTPYRLGVFHEIAKQWNGPFRLAFCAATEPGRSWDFDFTGLDVEMLAGGQWRPPLQANPMSVKWNLGIGKSLAAFRPDVVVMSGYVHPTVHLAARWCRSNRVPYGIVCETTPRSTAMSGWKWVAKRAIAGPLVRRMTFGLPLGREAEEYLRALGATRQPMYPFPNTPDTRPFVEAAADMAEPAAEAALRAQLGIPAGKRILLFAGRLIDAKRPLDLVEAFRSLGPRTGDAVLVMVGDGPLMPALRAAAEGLPVVFAGWVSDPKIMARLMAVSTAMALPSQLETWGAVVNEAMATGTPVIASDRVGAAVELIENGVTGYIHPVGDKVALASAIEMILADDARTRAMGAAARQVALARDHGFAAASLVTAARAALGKG